MSEKSWISYTAPKKPKVLLIDDMVGELERHAPELEARGFDVVKAEIASPLSNNSAGPDIIKLGGITEVIKFAMHRVNGIDAVITDFSKLGDDSYGRWVVKELKKAGFEGPIFVHSSQGISTSPETIREDGAVGSYIKGENWDEIASVISARFHAKRTPPG